MKNLKTRFSQNHAFLVTTLMYSQCDVIINYHTLIFLQLHLSKDLIDAYLILLKINTKYYVVVTS